MWMKLALQTCPAATSLLPTGGILSFDIHKRAVAGLVLWKSQMKTLERKGKLFSVFNFCLLVPFRQSWCTLRIRRSLLAIIFHLRSEGGKEQNYDFAEMKSEMFYMTFKEIKDNFCALSQYVGKIAWNKFQMCF